MNHPPKMRTDPYPGLRAFRRDESDIFYGREEQIDELIDRLASLRLLAVAGESGCGKSSLVRAGLIPALEAGFLSRTSAMWRIAEIRPGDQPTRRLAAALLPALGSDGPSADDVGIMTARLRRGPLGIIEVLRDAPLPEGCELLILVDQFEELIRFRRSVSADEADAFVALLLATVSQAEHVRVVLTLRTDYIGKCAVFRGLPEALNRAQYLTPLLTREQLHEAIVFPARASGGDVDPALANQIVNEIGRSQDQLPVVQHALMWMWNLAKKSMPTPEATQTGTPTGPTLDLKIYESIGGLGNALSKHADEVYGSLTPERQRIARRMFCALWEEGAKTSDNRRPCRVDQAAAIAGVSVDEFKVVADAFRASEHCFLMPADWEGPLERTNILDVSHESLFRHWDELKHWLMQESKDADEYRDWRNRALRRKGGSRDLLNGTDLVAALEWQARAQPNAAWAARYEREPGEYAATLELFRQSKEAQVARKRRKLATGTVIFVIAIACGIKIVQWRQDQWRHSVVQRLTAAAQSTTEPTRALQLALQAASALSDADARDGFPSDDNPKMALRQALRRSRFRAVIIASSGSFCDARLLPGDTRAVTVGAGDGLALWELATGRRRAALFGSDPAPRTLAVASGGHRAASAGGQGAIDLWDLDEKRHLRTFEGHVDRINAMAFSQSGKWLASASDDGSARLWSVDEPEEHWHPLIDHIGPVLAVAFSHDDETLATAGQDERIVFWDTRSGKKLKTFATGEKRFTGIAFSSSGRLFAGAQSRAVFLWDPATGATQGDAWRPGEDQMAMALSPDGTWVASVGLDGALRLWNTRTRLEAMGSFNESALSGDAVREIGAKSAATTKAQDAPDAASSGAAGTTAATDSAGLCGNDARAMSRTVAFGPDGRQLISAEPDGTAKVWSVLAGAETEVFPAHEGAVSRLVLSPDGKWLGTAGGDGVKLWEPNCDLSVSQFRPEPSRIPPVMMEIKELELPFDVVGAGQAPAIAKAVAFDASGRLAVTVHRSSDQSRVYVWNLEAGKAPVRALPREGLDPGGIANGVAILESKDGIRVISASDSPPFAQVWDLRNGRRLFALDTKIRVRAIAVTPDQRDIITECADADHASVTKLCVWDADSGTRRDTLPGISAEESLWPVKVLALSRDGHWLVSAGHKDNITRIWDLRKWELADRMDGHKGAADGVAISNAGILAMAGDSLRLRDVTHHHAVPGFPDARPGSSAVTFSPNGDYVFAGGRDGNVRIFALDPKVLLPFATQRIPFPLSDADCERYSGSKCLAPPADRGANQRRWALRDPAKKGLPHAGIVEGNAQLIQPERFESSRVMQEAFQNIHQALDDAVRRLSPPSSSNPDFGGESLDRLKASVRAGTDAAAARLSEAARKDPGLSFGADHAIELATRVAIGGLLQHAREAVDDDKGDAAAILQLLPGRPAEWAKETAQQMQASAAIRWLIENIERVRPEDAASRIKSLGRPPKDGWLSIAWRIEARVNANATDANREGTLTLTNRVLERADNTELVTEQAALLRDLFYRSGDNSLLPIIDHALQRALELDPTNETAKLMRGRLYASSQIGRSGQAAELLSTVSPSAPEYSVAASLAARIYASDGATKRADGYQLLVSAAEAQAASILADSILPTSEGLAAWKRWRELVQRANDNIWPYLAEASLATGRLLEARLVAGRVLKEGSEDLRPDVELAMLAVRVSAAAMSGDLEPAKSALDALVGLVKGKRPKPPAWDYNGSRLAAGRLTDPAQRRFIRVLIDYCASWGQVGSPEQLTSLLCAIKPAQSAGRSPVDFCH